MQKRKRKKNHKNEKWAKNKHFELGRETRSRHQQHWELWTCDVCVCVMWMLFYFCCCCFFFISFAHFLLTISFIIVFRCYCFVWFLKPHTSPLFMKPKNWEVNKNLCFQIYFWLNVECWMLYLAKSMYDSG